MFQIVSQEALTRLLLEKWIPNKNLVGETGIEPAVRPPHPLSGVPARRSASLCLI